ncbi:MAG TPA: hypothetical protein VMT42_01960 [candidate division Zixibacteria bacterium]|nr:hypothetical protein [candidate division Zixibacteria bacterium]
MNLNIIGIVKAMSMFLRKASFLLLLMPILFVSYVPRANAILPETLYYYFCHPLLFRGDSSSINVTLVVNYYLINCPAPVKIAIKWIGLQFDWMDTTEWIQKDLSSSPITLQRLSPSDAIDFGKFEFQVPANGAIGNHTLTIDIKYDEQTIFGGWTYDNYSSKSYALQIYGVRGGIGDFKVQLSDLVLLARSYGSKLGTSNWNPNMDLDGNGIVGLSDLIILAHHYVTQDGRYTVVGTLTYMPLNAVYVGINVESVDPAFVPNLEGSLLFLAVNGQLGATFPTGFTSGDRVSIVATINMDTHTQTYVINLISITRFTR